MLYQELPIYKSSYELLLGVFSLTKQFPREYRYSLWERLHSLCVDVIISIYQSNSDKEKRKTLLAHIRTHIETIRLLVRVSKDMGILSLVSFIQISEKIENISKQVVWWEKTVNT